MSYPPGAWTSVNPSLTGGDIAFTFTEALSSFGVPQSEALSRWERLALIRAASARIHEQPLTPLTRPGWLLPRLADPQYSVLS